MLVPRRLSNALCAGLLLCLPGAAAAVPVNHTIDASLSMLSANVSGTIALAVHTNLGTVNGNAVAAGSLSSNTESGNINLDWGSPTWVNQLDVAAGDANFNTGPVGAVPGNATLDLFGFIPVNFNLSINVDFLTITFDTPFSSPTFPSEFPPGAGPWSGGDFVDLGLGAQIDFTGTGPFGIAIANNNIGIGPSTIASIPVPLALAHFGVDGSAVTLTIPGLSLSLPPQPTANFASPGCEFGQTSLGCTLNVSSIDVTLTSLTFSNIQGTLVATQSGTEIVPEPSVLGLVALGLAGLGFAARRRA